MGNVVTGKTHAANVQVSGRIRENRRTLGEDLGAILSRKNTKESAHPEDAPKCPVLHSCSSASRGRVPSSDRAEAFDAGLRV